MTLSFNELESLARKAARGAGMTWGMAEEAGRAARWLCERSLPGAESLACLLSGRGDPDPDAVRPRRPEAVGGDWRAEAGALCPIAAGAALCDFSCGSAVAPQIETGPMSCPALLLPFAAWTADAAAPIKVSWSGVRAVLDAGETHLDASDPSALTADKAEAVNVGPAAEACGAAAQRALRADVPCGAQEILERFAHRTYAPATQQSREAGAGAGLSDND